MPPIASRVAERSAITITMGALIHRISVATQAHPKRIFGLWLLIILVTVPFAMHESDHLVPGGFAAAGSQSARVEGILMRDFPEVGDARIAVLLWPRAHATAATLRADIARVGRSLHGISGVRLTSQAQQLALFSTDLVGPIILPLQVVGDEHRAEAIDDELHSRLGVGGPVADGVEIHLLGEGALWTGLHETDRRDLANAEKIGFPVVLVVLLLVFGSLSAASLPMLLGIGSVIVTSALIYGLSLIFSLSIFITNTASLIGIGVAVDYSLIILARVRQELRAGRDLDEAQAIALTASGRTVIFSGLTVIASLAGLWIIRDGTLRSMALGAIVAVAISVTMAVTLLPALITLFGARRIGANVFAVRIAQRRRFTRRSRFSWERWTQAVTRRPILSLLIAGSLLVILCIPALSMQTGTGALRELNVANETRIGDSEAASIQGAGALGPIYVVLHTTTAASRSYSQTRIEQLRTASEGLKNVRHVGRTTLSADGSYALFPIIPTVDPESPAAKRIVTQLRALGSAMTPGAIRVAVGGTSAIQLDQEQEIAAGMWKAIFAVLAISFIILALLLRSLVLPLKAVVMNLLSVGAAYGVLVVVFQWGWSDSVLGFHSLGHLEVLTPPLILAIVFGLSMDYEVFLLSRIRERWLVSASSSEAVAGGLAASAGAITSAALILVCVFAVFVGTGVASIKEIGLGGAVAIGIDATLVRLVLVPALITLLGTWNWWWPHRFERVFGGKALLDRASA
jgi:uncharacterized membrane protein YdfJ with MMPL/SSD domain